MAIVEPYDSIIMDSVESVPSDALYRFRVAIKDINAGLNAFKTLVDMGQISDADAGRMSSSLQERYNVLTHRLRTYLAFNRSLVTYYLPPKIDRSKVRGMLAYRVWQINDVDETDGLAPIIYSSSQDFVWKEVTFADTPPTQTNHHGLHARLLMPSLLIDGVGYSTFCSGFVELLGDIQEHSDGVVRAECAKMICVYFRDDNEDANARLSFNLLDRFRYQYPNVPYYVVTDDQLNLIVAREVLISMGYAIFKRSEL